MRGVLILMVVGNLVLLWRRPAPPSPEPRPPQAEATPLASPGVAEVPEEPPAGGVPGERNLYDILQGVVELDKGRHPLTRDQAAAVIGVVTGKTARIEQACRTADAIERTLTPRQKQYLDKRWAESRHGPAPRSHIRFFRLYLEKKAGQGAPATLSAPGLRGATSGKPSLYADLLTDCFAAMERDATLRLTPAQVQRLLPLYVAYDALPNTAEGFILEVLTAEQRAEVQAVLSRREFDEPSSGGPSPGLGR